MIGYDVYGFLHWEATFLGHHAVRLESVPRATFRGDRHPWHDDCLSVCQQIAFWGDATPAVSKCRRRGFRHRLDRHHIHSERSYRVSHMMVTSYLTGMWRCRRRAPIISRPSPRTRSHHATHGPRLAIVWRRCGPDRELPRTLNTLHHHLKDRRHGSSWENDSPVAARGFGGSERDKRSTRLRLRSSYLGI